MSETKKELIEGVKAEFIKVNGDIYPIDSCSINIFCEGEVMKEYDFRDGNDIVIKCERLTDEEAEEYLED